MPINPDTYIDAAHVFTPANGYVRWHTGGGCEAYVRELLDGNGIRVARIVVTDTDGMLPLDASAGLIVGVYPEGDVKGADEGFAGYTGMSFRTATLFIDAFVACHEATQTDDFNDAVGKVQEAVGQTDGGVAAMHFSGAPYDSDDEWNAHWASLPQGRRFNILLDYLQSEWSYHETANVQRDPLLDAQGWYVDAEAEDGTVENLETGERHAYAFTLTPMALVDFATDNVVVSFAQGAEAIGVDTFRNLLDAVDTYFASVGPEAIGPEERLMEEAVTRLRRALPPMGTPAA